MDHQNQLPPPPRLQSRLLGLRRYLAVAATGAAPAGGDRIACSMGSRLRNDGCAIARCGSQSSGRAPINAPDQPHHSLEDDALRRPAAVDPAPAPPEEGPEHYSPPLQPPAPEDEPPPGQERREAADQRPASSCYCLDRWARAHQKANILPMLRLPLSRSQRPRTFPSPARWMKPRTFRGPLHLHQRRRRIPPHLSCLGDIKPQSSRRIRRTRASPAIPPRKRVNPDRRRALQEG